MAATGESRFWGSVLILSGTAIGAGMLALPLTAADIGFWTMAGLMLFVFLFAVLSALLMLEANLAIEPGCSLYTMASRTLGTPGRVLATVSPLWLFYSLLAAYLAGGGSLIYQFLGAETGVLFARQLSVVVFAVIAGGFVYYSTRSVDLLNRLLFSVMVMSLLVALVMLASQTEYQNLIRREVGAWPALAALPIIFTSFGFHGSIPSLILYMRKNLSGIAAVFILGASIPFLVYLLWIYTSVGSLTSEQLRMIDSTGELISELSVVANTDGNLKASLYVFSDLALLTSFLGVALGLFDYLANLLKRNNSRSGRLQTAAATFVPPILFALCFPQGFVVALGYASVALAVLAVILPAWIVLKLRKKRVAGQYRIPIGSWAAYSSLAFGGLIIAAQISTLFW
ncbi:hypothetical protein EOPP23_04040 [Endozoicomonas sp. OPT23]|uniref:aromatic amino acid transport family protein n=1 Tax=Endozoicomonas sp. OPT23 TaxID=2072845 RepID=UPI00129BEFD5|nr:aromatic amino acid transport family protein [Endozoicomonas sp. OPT23]MRI32166.1 hypothetical protein [Endozoicomonas sp. OPT23]